MRICLITKEYPANSLSDSESVYMTELAQGLDLLGHEVTVICSEHENNTGNEKIRVVVAVPSAKIEALKLIRQTMPKSVVKAASLLGFWHAFAECGATFDVVEATQTLCGALLTAFSRETPTVLRASSTESKSGELSTEKNFDDHFGSLTSDYAYSCVDMFSCASPNAADLIRQMPHMTERQVAVNAAQSSEDIASAALTIYAHAIENFSRVKKPHLYRHGALRLIRSTEDMITLYDRMLYDLLFRVSYKFRIGHWFGKLRRNPDLLKAKLVERFSHKG